MRETTEKKTAKKTTNPKKATAKKTTAKKTATSGPAAHKTATRRPAAQKKFGAPAVAIDDTVTIPDAPDQRSGTSADSLAAEPTLGGVEDHTGAWDDDLWGGDWDDLGAFTADPGRAQPTDGQPDGARRLAGDGAEMFQHAALELIAAARNALDAAEELVSDPGAVGTVLESFKDIAAELLRSGRPASRRHPATDPPREHADFQSIRVDDD